MGSRCSHCEALYVPPRPLCSKCYMADMEWQELSGEGKLTGFTAIAIAPGFMAKQGFGRQKPYLTGVVQLAEGPSVSGRIEGMDPSTPEKVAIGTEVKAMFLKNPDLAEGHLVMLGFKPIASASDSRETKS